MKKTGWAIRVAYASGGGGFIRVGGVIGRGPILTFDSKAYAEVIAEHVRDREAGATVTVIERSHGRRDRVASSGSGE